MNSSSTVPSTSFSIVVGLKFTDGGAYAVDQAARIAQRMMGASVHLVHVFPKALTFEESESMRAHLKLYADDKLASLGDLSGTIIGVHLRVGDVADAILQLATDISSDLIVLGATEHRLAARLSAKTVERVMTAASCPVLLAGPKPRPSVIPPAIEPACAACVEARFESQGAQWWCAHHRERAVKAHTFSYARDLPFATHDSNLGPTGN